MTGIILAGGENRRMGRDKAFLTLHGRPLVEHVLAALDSTVKRIVVVTNAPDRYAKYPVRTVADVFDSRGPLTGIYSGMLASADDYCVVVACDMPFLSRILLSYLASAAEGNDVVVPEVAGNYEPLHAVYHRRLLALMEREIREGRQKVQALFAGARVRVIPEAEIRQLDPAFRSFVNLNTPEQYKEALCSDWAPRS